MSPENQPIYDMLRDIHGAQREAAASLGKIEQAITDIQFDARESKVKLDKHEKAYVVVKFLGLPALGLLHITIKAFLERLGWH